MKVNLGAGRQAYEHPGYISVDIRRSDGIDYVWDCNNGLPQKEMNASTIFTLGVDMLDDVNVLKVFPDNSVDEFLCKHFLEHLTTEGFMRLMDEMWDALKPGGILWVKVPNAEHIRAADSDPTHQKRFTKWTFDYFTKESLAAFPYTDKAWKILEGYPKVNGTSPDDLWELEFKLTPDK